jgi:hypothetical protein
MCVTACMSTGMTDGHGDNALLTRQRDNTARRGGDNARSPGSDKTSLYVPARVGAGRGGTLMTAGPAGGHCKLAGTHGW